MRLSLLFSVTGVASATGIDCEEELHKFCPSFFKPDAVPDVDGCSKCVQKKQPNMHVCTLTQAMQVCAELGPGPAPTPSPSPTPSPPTPFPPGTELYVALHGDDTAPGTEAKPFSTLQRCLDVAPPGGTCFLAGGRYDREWDQQTVVASKPVTISGAKAGVMPAVLDGSVPLSTKWSKVGGPQGMPGHATACIYTSEPLEQQVSQVWVAPAGSERAAVGGDNVLTNLAPLTPARFPNAKLSDDSVFDAAPFSVSGRKNGSMLYSLKTSTSGRIIDDGQHKPSVASSGIDFTGTVAVLALGTMGNMAQGVRVNKHVAGQAAFSHDIPSGTFGKGHTNIPYFFEGSCKLLDAEGEWCSEQGRLHVWLDGCADPNSHRLRGKVRQHLLNATKVHNKDRSVALKLEHLTLWAGNLNAPQSDIALDHVQLLYPSWHRRALGETGTTEGMELDFNKVAGSIRMVNSTMAWDTSIVPFNRVGKDAYFSGNLFTRGGYALGESASLSDGGSASGLVFEHNTITRFNAFVGITPGLTSTIAYNLFSHQGPSADGAGVHVHIQPQNGVLIYRNWALDLTVKSFRFDRVNKAGATWGVNGTVMENVAMRTGTACFKGDEHYISNNLNFDVLGDDVAVGKVPALMVMMYDPSKSWSIKGENAHTVVKDNAADSIFNISGKLPGIHSGNVAGMRLRPMLVDPDNLDFRPRPGSKLIGVGAYPDPTAEYWRPGCEGSSERRASASSGLAAAQAFYAQVRDSVALEPSFLV